eukprot:195093_1
MAALTSNPFLLNIHDDIWKIIFSYSNGTNCKTTKVPKKTVIDSKKKKDRSNSWDKTVDSPDHRSFNDMHMGDPNILETSNDSEHDLIMYEEKERNRRHSDGVLVLRKQYENQFNGRKRKSLFKRLRSRSACKRKSRKKQNNPSINSQNERNRGIYMDSMDQTDVVPLSVIKEQVEKYQLEYFECFNSVKHVNQTMHDMIQLVLRSQPSLAFNMHLRCSCNIL